MSENIIVTSKENEERKPYVKPLLERVRLFLDETVLGTGCKDTVTVNPNNPTACHIPTTCSNEGS